MFIKLVKIHDWFAKHISIIGKLFLYTYIILGILLFCLMSLLLLFGNSYEKQTILDILVLSGIIIGSSCSLGALLIKFSNWFNKHYYQAKKKLD